MKKLIYSLFLFSVLIFLLPGCGVKDNDSDTEYESKSITQNPEIQTDEKLAPAFNEDTYIQEVALEMIKVLQELIVDDGYFRLTNCPSELLEVIGFWKNLSIDTSKPVQQLIMTEETFQNLFDIIAEESDENIVLSEPVQKIFCSKIGNSISSMINSQCGAKVMAASSMFNYSRTYVPKGSVRNQVLFIPASDGIYFSVSISNTGDGAITANANFVDTADGVETILEAVYGPDTFSLNEILWSE